MAFSGIYNDCVAIPIQKTSTLSRLIRFCKYSTVGVSVFAADLLLAYIMIMVFSVPDMLAIGCAFLIATTTNYFINRLWAFGETGRGVFSGLWYFFGITCFALVLILLLVYLLTDYVGMSILAARVMAAGLVGLCSFYLQSIVTFRLY